MPGQQDAARILVVEDDRLLSADLEAFLSDQNFTVETAPDVPAARAAFARQRPDICLVDIVMPGPSGKLFCRDVVDRSDTGVVMMSSLSDSETIIALLEIGADDYLVKPFQFGEMLARLRAVLRRRQAGQGAQPGPSRIGPWTLEPRDRQLRHAEGFTVKMTPSETEVLRFMLASPRTIFSREDLLAVSRTRQHEGSDDRAIDNLFKRLRKKVEADTANPRYLVTERGKGYRFNP
jgi:DNA-binding response OmpR family regulator